MQLAKILGRGQVTVPRQVRRELGLEPGDTVVFEVVGPGRVEMRTLPAMRLSEALGRYHVVDQGDDARDRVEWQRRAAKDVIGG